MFVRVLLPVRPTFDAVHSSLTQIRGRIRLLLDRSRQLTVNSLQCRAFRDAPDCRRARRLPAQDVTHEKCLNQGTNPPSRLESAKRINIIQAKASEKVSNQAFFRLSWPHLWTVDWCRLATLASLGGPCAQVRPPPYPLLIPGGGRPWTVNLRPSTFDVRLSTLNFRPLPAVGTPPLQDCRL